MTTGLRILRIPCTTPATAATAANRLARYLDTAGTDGRHLLIPASYSPAFVWGLAQHLQALGYGDDTELATWATDATTTPPWADHQHATAGPQSGARP